MATTTETTKTISEHLADLGITKRVKIVNVRGQLVHQEGPHGARHEVPAASILPVGATLTIPGEGCVTIEAHGTAGYRKLGGNAEDLAQLVASLLDVPGATIAL